MGKRKKVGVGSEKYSRLLRAAPGKKYRRRISRREGQKTEEGSCKTQDCEEKQETLPKEASGMRLKKRKNR